MNKNLELFLTFAKIGVITFGGGYAMIANIKEEVVDKKKWLSNNELLDVVAIAESTPGPIAINVATYVGFKKNKLLGSIMATLGVVLPSFIIIFLISLFLDKFLANKYVAYAFKGIKCGVCFLIFKAAITMIKESKFDMWQLFLFSIACTTMIVLPLVSASFSSIYLILIGGLVGYIVYLVYGRKEIKEEDDEK